MVKVDLRFLSLSLHEGGRDYVEEPKNAASPKSRVFLPRFRRSLTRTVQRRKMSLMF